MRMEVTLRPDERVVDEFSIGARFFQLMVGGGIALAILIPVLGMMFIDWIGVALPAAAIWGLIGVGLLFGSGIVGNAFYFRSARYYVFTNQRILETIGWLSKRTISIDYEQITDIRVAQDLFERLILGTGYVAVNTAGTDIEEINLERVADPYRVSNKIRQLHDARLKETGQQGSVPPPPVRAGSQQGAIPRSQTR